MLSVPCAKRPASSAESRSFRRPAPSFLLVAVAAVLALGVVGPGCVHHDQGRVTAEARPLPRAVAASLAPGQASLGPWGLELAPTDSTSEYELFTFGFRVYGEIAGDFRRVTGEYYRTRAAREAAPAPLIVLSPILAGPIDDYLASRYFAAAAAARGISALFLHQETMILDPGRDGFALERRMRQNIRDNRRAIDLFAELPDVDSGRLGSLGISLGAVKNVVLIAADPRLRANVLCLAGTDLPRLLVDSREALVESYLSARRERDGLEPRQVAEEIRIQLQAAPRYCAPTIAAERVLLFLGRLDDKVPYAQGLELREALGEPETYVLPSGHYSSLVFAPWVATRAFEWMQRRWTAVSASP